MELKVETRKVVLSDKAKRDLKKIPQYIVRKLVTWIDFTTKYGLTETKKIYGFNDKALRGKRKGQRSIRLNKAYRAFYTEHDNGSVELNYIEVIEVNNHEY